MSAEQTPAPKWAHWPEEQLRSLTDAQLREHVAYWQARRRTHTQLADQFALGDSRRYRDAYSAWWCSKIMSRSMAILAERRGR